LNSIQTKEQAPVNIQPAVPELKPDTVEISTKAAETESANTADEKPKKGKKKEIVYVSKNPDRAVGATGVVAGTSGMVGGAVLGGLVGVAKLPGEITRTTLGQDYVSLLTKSYEGFKNSISNSPELQKFVSTITKTKSPETAEAILNIVSTMTERLHYAFANDPHASAVIDKIVDPIIKGVAVKKNFISYGSGYRGLIKSPAAQTVLKFLGFNRKTSKIVGKTTGHIAEGFAQAVENVKNFTPEEKQAWGRVTRQMFKEFENNPKIKSSVETLKAIGGLKNLVKDPAWLTNPLRNMQKTILEGVKHFDRDLGNMPIKTIGKWSAIGALACGTLSTLGWFGLKKMLMKKETAKTQAAE